LLAFFPIYSGSCAYDAIEEVGSWGSSVNNLFRHLLSQNAQPGCVYLNRELDPVYMNWSANFWLKHDTAAVDDPKSTQSAKLWPGCPGAATRYFISKSDLPGFSKQNSFSEGPFKLYTFDQVSMESVPKFQ
jgi:hypothetical protein